MAEASPRAVGLVAFDDVAVVGFLYALAGHDDVRGAYLDKLHVSPHRRARGIGSKPLLALSERHLNSGGDSGLCLFAYEDNVPTRRYYERLGARAAAGRQRGARRRAGARVALSVAVGGQSSRDPAGLIVSASLQPRPGWPTGRAAPGADRPRRPLTMAPGRTSLYTRQPHPRGIPHMKAAVVTESGLQIRDVPKPAPKPNEVLIRVRACGLNRADAMVAGGMAHGRAGGAGTVVGLEYVGDVEAVGAEVKTVKPGDRVMCSGMGGWAEYAVADWGRAIPMPGNNMTWSQAATLPVALSTMHNAVVTAGRLEAGEAVMIQGASSGVGLMGQQIAKAMGASLVIGSSTNPERRARLTEFGADLAVDSRDEGWVQQVLDATGGNGVDLIVDQISGYVANQNLAATKILGRIVNVGRLGGFKGEFNFDLHAQRRIDYIGVTFRTRSVDEVRDLVKAMRADLWPAVEAGKLALPIDREFSLDEAPAAVDYMKANKHFGKIVLNVSA